jgi:hypothetical protein
MKKTLYIIVSLMFSIFCDGCDCDLGDIPKGPMPPDFLFGEWMTSDNNERIIIQKDFNIVVQNNQREYHFVVNGQGKRIFADMSILKQKTIYKYVETTGNLVISESTRLEDTFPIFWNNLNSKRMFGIFRFKSGYALYTYVGDPDAPSSRILLYKKTEL